MDHLCRSMCYWSIVNMKQASRKKNPRTLFVRRLMHVVISSSRVLSLLLSLSLGLIHSSRPPGFKCGTVHPYRRHLNTCKFPYFLIACNTFKLSISLRIIFWLTCIVNKIKCKFITKLSSRTISFLRWLDL